MVIPVDVRKSLKVLPETLTDAYGEIYNRIEKQRGSASQLALSAFRWVQFSYEPLRSETLLDAVTVEVGGLGEFSRKCEALTAIDLLKVCQNLLILDERLNVFRFAHLSVEEYLETKELKVDPHTEIAKICLSLVCSSRSWADYDESITTREGHYQNRHLLLYSAVFWPWHLNRCNDNCQILAALWEAFLSEATFWHWINYHRLHVQISYPKDTFWRRSEALQKEGRNSFSVVCVFGLGRMLASTPRSQFGPVDRPKSNKPNSGIFEFLQSHRVNHLLLYASRFGDLDIAQHLLDAGVGASAAYEYAEAPLYVAAQNGHDALARLLLDRGADVSVARNNGKTPLHLAAEKGHKALARLLLGRGADVSVATSSGWTPLHLAAQNGHEALARLLLDRGADVSVARDDWSTPLCVAAKNGHEALARLLLDRGADVSAASNDGWTPLHFAAQNGHEALARLLLNRGADVSAASNDEWTPLHFAAQNGHEALARLLLDRGADVSAANSSGRTPPREAEKSGHEALARLLEHRGADSRRPTATD